MYLLEHVVQLKDMCQFSSRILRSFFFLVSVSWTRSDNTFNWKCPRKMRRWYWDKLIISVSTFKRIISNYSFSFTHSSYRAFEAFTFWLTKKKYFEISMQTMVLGNMVCGVRRVSCGRFFLAIISIWYGVF